MQKKRTFAIREEEKGDNNSNNAAAADGHPIVIGHLPSGGEPLPTEPDSGDGRGHAEHERGAGAEGCGDPKAGRAGDVPAARGDAAGPRAVAIDIETTGLEPDCRLTCVCAYDGHTGSTWVFPPDLLPEQFLSNRYQILQCLAGASHILAYNGAYFDLPVLARCLDAPIGPWMDKLVDPLYAARALWHAGQRLDDFLALNGMPLKTGTGAHAVELARDGRWVELGEYCMMDTRLTYDVIFARGWWAPGVRYTPWAESVVFSIDMAYDGER